MSTILIVKKGQMGSNTYYLTTMKASSLIREVGYAFELADGAGSSIVQNVDQEFRMDRVVNDLVPYITMNEDWFFGTLTVLVYKGGNKMHFESFEEALDPFGIELLGAGERLDEIGYLTLPDDRRLVVIDGQHRLAALAIAIYGMAGIPPVFSRRRPAEYEGMEIMPHPEIAHADISVMLLVPQSGQDFGKITNKLDKQVKYSTRSAEILHSDDDIIAIVARKMIDDDDAPLRKINKHGIVNCKNNTISDRSRWFTTISAVYNICEIILRHYSITNKVRADEHIIDNASEIMKKYWEQIMGQMNDYREYINLVQCNAPIDGLRYKSLLLKPAMQTAIAYAIGIVLNCDPDCSNILDDCNNVVVSDKFTYKLNEIDWSWNNELWKGILIGDGRDRRVKSGKQAIKVTGQIIAYMLLGDDFKDGCVGKERLLNDFRRMKDDERIELPDVR